MLNLGKYVIEDPDYASMKVGEQVQRYEYIAACPRQLNNSLSES